MKRRCFSVNRNLSKKSSSIILKSQTKKFQKAKENYPKFSHKSLIEVLLRLIKDTQNQFLSAVIDEKKNPLNCKNKMSVKLTKDLLFSLKNSLSSIHKEKLNELNFFNKEKKEKQNAFYSLKKTKIISKEINQLKDINFRNENEIKKFDNLIKDKNKYLFLITSYDCFMEIFSENYIKSKKDDEIIDKIYREKLKNEKLNLFGIANEILLKEKKSNPLKKK